MTRRYREHDLRAVASLDGVWDFAFVGDVKADSIDLNDIHFDSVMPVPGCFDAMPKYAGMRGLVAYRTILNLAEEARYRLVFEAVHHWCRLFVDKKQIGEHSGGFTRFDVDFMGKPGEVEIILLVDNRLDNGCSPLHLDYYDWYHFGGITRPVRLHCLRQVWIDRVRVTTGSLDPPTVMVQVDIITQVVPAESTLTIKINDEIHILELISLENTHSTWEYVIPLKGKTIWSPNSPNLHLLYVMLGDDDLRVRFGMREVRVVGRDIHINGEAVRLLGFNRHEAHPQFGHALPETIMATDVQQLLDLGCNFVRGSHYPQDSRFLDLCDEAGICVWVEATGWQQTAQHLADESYLDAQLRNVDEMVAMAFNHPSVVMWGALNEGASHDPNCMEGYAEVLQRIRSLDNSRPVTYASNHIPDGDLNLHLVDLVSINAYPGWYHGEIDEIPKILEDIFVQVDSAGQGDKPIIISEIGAGAIPGWRDWNATRWTEQYQARLLEIVIRCLFLDNKRVAGLAIWQFCDIRTSETASRILGRPRGFNNKGVVDEYRRPKLAYGVIKRLFSEIASDERNLHSDTSGIGTEN